jgi:hypothetical protein
MSVELARRLQAFATQQAMSRQDFSIHIGARTWVGFERIHDQQASAIAIGTRPTR